MTTLNELREEQRRVVKPDTPSLGYLVGEAVTNIVPVANPGELWSGGTPIYVGVIRMDAGNVLRGVSEDGTEFPVDVTRGATTDFGLSIGVAINNIDRFKRINYDNNPDITPDFSKFGVGPGALPGIRNVFVTLQANFRGGVIRTVTVTGANTWRINYSAAQPQFGAGVRPTGGRPGLPDSRIVVLHSTVQRARSDIIRFENLDANTPFGTTLLDKTGWDFHPTSSKNTEKGTHDGVFLDWTRELDGRIALRLTAYEGENPYAASLLYAQLSGYEAPRQENRTGPITIPTEPTRIGPSNVDYKLEWYNQTQKIAEQTLTLANTNQLQTLGFATQVQGANRIVISTEVKNRLAWIRTVDVNFPRSFLNIGSTYHNVASNTVEAFTQPLSFFVTGRKFQIPSIATLSGTRPNTYLTFSGTWDGTLGSLVPTRCPVWQLYEVLTGGPWALLIDGKRINLQSFLEASKYCNELINGKPRWAFDGELKGTQTEIVDNLLKVMDGSLILDGNGTFSLKIERPGTAQWIIGPANVLDQRINYREATGQRTGVRAIFTNRLTGQKKVTPGLATDRTVEVPWQDEDVAVRWARWRTLREEALLNTVEFGMAWEGERIKEGDLISVFDPSVAGLPTSGRVMQSGVTADNRTWLQLNVLPEKFWRKQIAGAKLLQQNARTQIDEKLWGYVFVDFSPRPLIQFQKFGGGIQDAVIQRILWNPGGSIEENRVELTTKIDVPNKTMWASTNFGDTKPTTWRVQSITENNDGREFSFVATRHLNGMHAFVEQNTPLPAESYIFEPVRGTNLSSFDGPFSRLNDTYPLPQSIPFGYAGNFTDLSTSQR